MSTLPFLPEQHLRGLEAYVRALTPTQSNPQAILHSTLMAVQSTVQALLSSLSRPTNLISQIVAAKREADRNDSSIGRTSRWPLGLLDDTRQRLQEEKEKRARKSREQAGHLARELRYTQQTVASELAGWQELHETMGRRALREFAKGMVVQERVRLEGMMRALKLVRAGVRPQGVAGLGMAAKQSSQSSILTPDQKREVTEGNGVIGTGEQSGEGG